MYTAAITAIVAYGALAAAVVGLLGPLFIPFLLVEKLSFLFWGWLRAFIGFNFYKVVAAAVLSILGHLYQLFYMSLIPIEPITLITKLPLLILLVLVNIYLLFQIPAITSSIFSGHTGQRMQPQMMVQDRYFYDPAAGKYTVDRYLDDLEKRYGGIDAVLIWHTYTNIGVDSRNQYDLLGDMPGGVAGVRQMIADFHRRGVRVLFPVMLWDRGTRDEGAPNWVATARLLAEVGADGVNGDTLAELPLAFREASDATGHPLAFEPEGAPENPAEALAWNNMSWGYWKYPFEPMVGLYKWLEPRHLVHVCD